ncbi:hypothetical protein H8L32_07400 [Undibacterium sp. CY18W]|uniref:Uncharacterized protein n=1 Tax=Undibacterium hunanense TaxID=2762292 RepID=A0ABR6ZP81_9BURK|nr:hypothetical protein [Undibacterium hunanense]MBC3917295.1 hypothetical protein [Undibacterium hunanense]
MKRFGGFAGFVDWRWHLDIFVLRYGWWPLTGAAVFLSSLLLWLVWLPVQKAHIQSELQELSVQLDSADEGKPVQVRNALNLPLEVIANEGVQGILLLAKKHGLTIAQADYKRHENGHIGRWQLQLPVTASYPQIRQFIRAARNIPGSSLDEVVLRGGDAGVEARLSFSIWFEVEKPNDVPVEGGG